MQTVAEEREMPMDPHDAQFKRIDERFDEVNRRITEGREETQQRFDRIEGDIRQLREVDFRDLKTEVKGDIAGVRGEVREVKGEVREVRAGLAEVQSSFNRFVLGAATSWVILMVTILARGI
jgi:tetrahydromethanopterin S-methyltransferase subunit G